jgi:hypothetical protein
MHSQQHLQLLPCQQLLSFIYVKNLMHGAEGRKCGLEELPLAQISFDPNAQLVRTASDTLRVALLYGYGWPYSNWG